MKLLRKSSKRYQMTIIINFLGINTTLKIKARITYIISRTQMNA